MVGEACDIVELWHRVVELLMHPVYLEEVGERRVEGGDPFLFPECGIAVIAFAKERVLVYVNCLGCGV